ncbi:hypothetical protein BDA99DRAFT_537048 [Phascolomyces articulosus]|uniref:Uncharacterized protein n=1 Tax=Phascolomyces articulosus TaxID=60185 RepID=A0AAD5KAP7_9FUNG|nr:hypothetical protein BDA99DRAFT_537048 [Phascolomyces articulosus]
MNTEATLANTRLCKKCNCPRAIEMFAGNMRGYRTCIICRNRESDVDKPVPEEYSFKNINGNTVFIFLVYNLSGSRVSSKKKIQICVPEVNKSRWIVLLNSRLGNSVAQYINIAALECKSTPLLEYHEGEGSSVAAKVLKRSIADLYATPEVLLKQMQGIKGDLKRRYIDMDKLRDHPMNTLYKLPPGLYYFIQKDSVYYQLQDEVKDRVLYSRQINNQDSDIESFFDEHAAKLVECVLVSPQAWMMVRQVEAYVSNNPQADDYALNNEQNVFNCTHGSYYRQELFQRNMEGGGHSVQGFGVLVTSLLVGDDSNNINNKTFDVIVPVDQVLYFQSTRYLRDYTKNAAPKQRSYISKRFLRNNFETSHCLSIDTHPSRANKIYKDRASLESLVIGMRISTRVGYIVVILVPTYA